MDGVQVVEALAALAQESRLAVFRLLVKEGPGGLPAGVIAEKVGIPATTLSFHLSQMSHAGLVISRRHGRSVFYAADYGRMQDLLGFLMANCCQGSGGCEPPMAARRRRLRTTASRPQKGRETK